MAASPEHSTVSISDIGEAELIRRFAEGQSVAGTGDAPGIGDDCAVLDYNERQKLLVTTDLLAERVHFIKENSSARNIGYKSAAVNFSDIAAMGGRPTGLFLSLALPAETPVSWVEEFRKGLFELCEQYKVPLLGGDTTGSGQDIIINVTVLGKVDTENVKLRSGAAEGDTLCVTGTLGDSAAGLRLLSDDAGKKINKEDRIFLAERHLKPRPAVEEGIWLGKEGSVHAMIDLSDGLATDAGHIAERSKAGVDIDLDRIPVSGAFKTFVGEDQDKNFSDLTLGGGEDYHLLCAVDKNEFEDIAGRFRQRFETPLFSVGSVTRRHQGVQYFRNGKRISYTGAGFNHFKTE